MTVEITPAVVDDLLVKALTLPAWGDVEDELRDLFHSAPPRSVEGEPSMHTGLEAVYGKVLEMLALNLVLARAVLAGDDDQEPGEADDQSCLIDPSRVEALLERCDREDAHVPPSHRFLYTSEIRRLLGVEPRDTPAVSGWPPRAGDVWRDTQGDDWHAIDTKFGVQMLLDGTAGHSTPAHVFHNYGPLTFVRHETPKDAS
ncbi:hypothetical protein [Nonomuraea bangladeshensis]|uniref:hypothetical protein n=1 Tax=Nonomuraea bangladeshensis TaxID=404385 RepID=UPI003C2B4221